MPSAASPLRLIATLTAGIAVAGGLKRGLSKEPPRHDQAVADGRDPHGRTADTPSELPARAWFDILKRTFAEIGEDRIVAVAAGVAFYVLLAIVPAIGALVAIYGVFADRATIADHLALLSGILPSGALDVIGEQVRRIAGAGESTLGTAFLIGLGVSLWSANAGMKAIFDALNVAYGETEKRGFVRLTAQSLLFTLAAILFLIAAVGAVVVLPIVLGYVGLGGVAETLLKLLRWPLLLAGMVLALAVLYRYGPSRDKARWRWVTWGSAAAAVLWLAGSAAFSWYAANFGSYNETYGSLGAVVGFMTWMWLSAIAVLVGAELDAEMEHQTARDTTEGPPRPLGTRGARMADRVAPVS